MSDKLYSNVMIDLETMGCDPDAAIVAIGAVAFDLDAGELGPTWYERISLDSSMRGGGKIDPDTVIWWMTQADDARREITKPGACHISYALHDLARWMSKTAEPDVAVWGCGAWFDNVILRRAFLRAGIQVPWDWWNDRCYRTVKTLNRHVPFERVGEHHTALADATSQALHLIQIMSRSGQAETDGGGSPLLTRKGMEAKVDGDTT